MPVYCDLPCIVCGAVHRVNYCLLPVRPPAVITRPTVKDVDAYLLFLRMVTGTLPPLARPDYLPEAV